MATSYEEKNDHLDEIKELLLPYAQALNKDIEDKPISKATAYELAIAMIADIVVKILDYQEKKIIFPKKIILGLWNIKNGDDADTINLISILYRFMEICGSYPDAEFKRATYGANISRKTSGDMNYNLDPKQAYIQLKDCKFVLMLKVFRTIMGNSIKNTTGSYEVPDKKNTEKWKYKTIDSNRTSHFKTSSDFIQYIIDISEVYSNIDKLSPPLEEIYAIFNDAALAAKIEKELKYETNNTNNTNNKNNTNNTNNTTQKKYKKYVKGKKEKREEKKEEIIIKPVVPSVWGTINPITKVEIKIYKNQKEEEEEEEEEEDEDNDGFQVVSSRKNKNKKY